MKLLKIISLGLTVLLSQLAHASLNLDEWESVDFGYDNNGNVTELYDGKTGEVIGQYAYDPYGNTTKIEGEAAHENKTRFSTKEYDEVSGLYYYGYRHYDPKTGRWPSRDPIEEEGGMSLYAFVGNNSVSSIDILGRSTFGTGLMNGGPIGGLGGGGGGLPSIPPGACYLFDIRTTGPAIMPCICCDMSKSPPIYFGAKRCMVTEICLPIPNMTSAGLSLQWQPISSTGCSSCVC